MYIECKAESSTGILDAKARVLSMFPHPVGIVDPFELISIVVYLKLSQSIRIYIFSYIRLRFESWFWRQDLIHDMADNLIQVAT